MPKRKAVDFEQLQYVEVVLVPLDAPCGHPSPRSRPAPIADKGCSEITKPPGCCDRCRGKPSRSAVSAITRRMHGRCRGRSHARAGAPMDGMSLAPSVHGLCEFFDLVRWQPQGFGDIANRAAAAVADGDGRQRGAVAAIAVEHVLQTSSRRSCSKSTSMSGGSLRSSETKRSNSISISPGWSSVIPKRIADRGIGGGAPALAQDLLASGKAHDVVYGQEIGLVALPGDDPRVPSDQFACLGLFLWAGFGLCPAIANAFLDETAQPARWPYVRRGPVRAGTDIPAGADRTCSAGRCAPIRPAVPRDRSRSAPGACAGGVRRWGTAHVPLRPVWCAGGSRSSCPAGRGGGARACARRRWRRRACRVAARAAAMLAGARSSSGPRCSSIGEPGALRKFRLHPGAVIRLRSVARNPQSQQAFGRPVRNPRASDR